MLYTEREHYYPCHLARKYILLSPHIQLSGFPSSPLHVLGALIHCLAIMCYAVAILYPGAWSPVLTLAVLTTWLRSRHGQPPVRGHEVS